MAIDGGQKLSLFQQDRTDQEPNVMARKISFNQIQDIGLITLGALLLIGGSFWLTFQFIEPAPPKTITIATGSTTGGYYRFGNFYAGELKKAGIKLNVRPTAGSIENLKLLNDPDKKVDLAIMQGGITSGQSQDNLISLGRIFLEPLWVFHRVKGLTHLSELKGKRLAVGKQNSGTRHLALQILGANQIGQNNASLLELSGKAAVEALRTGEVDAVFLVLAPEAPLIQMIYKMQDIELLNFDQADAYERLYPFLTKVVLPKGVLDLVARRPEHDIYLLAATAGLVAHKDLHPALVNLLVNAAQKIHQKGSIFQQPNSFPKGHDPEYQISEEAARYYKSGPPFLQRYLPFWLASFLDRMFILLLPIATILIPVFKLAPWLYQYRIRNRILRRFAELKKLEHEILEDKDGENYPAHIEELNEIDHAVRHIPVPLQYTDQYYDLRSAIDLVRQRLKAIKQAKIAT